jgi:hypothetical protein
MRYYSAVVQTDLIFAVGFLCPETCLNSEFNVVFLAETQGTQ